MTQNEIDQAVEAERRRAAHIVLQHRETTRDPLVQSLLVRIANTILQAQSDEELGMALEQQLFDVEEPDADDLGG